jgi:hypothetical protein
MTSPSSSASAANIVKVKLPIAVVMSKFLLMRNEFEAKLLKFVDCVEKVGHAPTQSIESPDNNYVEASASGICQHLRQTWTYVSSSTDTIRVYPCNAPAAAFCKRAEQLLLHLRSLIETSSSPRLLQDTVETRVYTAAFIRYFESSIHSPYPGRVPAVYLKSAEEWILAFLSFSRIDNLHLVMNVG